MPTVATRARTPHLWKAINSVRAQRGVRARIVLVANGAACDAGLLARLGEHDDIAVLRSPVADFPNALGIGRKAVETAFFAELDDDDELTPDALAQRLELMLDDPGVDVVVSNGRIRSGGLEELSIPDIAAVRADPLRSLLQRNWLLPGSALFRTARVPSDWFNSIPRCLEWTWLGLNLSLHCRIAFLDEPAVVHYADLPFSTDASRHCQFERANALRALFALPVPADVRRRLRAKLGDALHSVSALHRAEGEWRTAWARHLESLTLPGGWRYLLYTRYLLGWPASRVSAGSARQDDPVSSRP
jgi:hypothetical protein